MVACHSKSHADVSDAKAMPSRAESSMSIQNRRFRNMLWILGLAFNAPKIITEANSTTQP
jgi:hypothetical protein